MVNDKFHCSEETYCILAGFVVQGEYGDYDPLEHTPGYLDEFPFLESASAKMKGEVEKLHQKNRFVICGEPHGMNQGSKHLLGMAIPGIFISLNHHV